MSEIRIQWRAPFESAALNRLHAEAFDHDVGEHDWYGQVQEHSLGWVCAFDADELVGFVNVPWDGRYHAYLMDTSVLAAAKRRGIGKALVAVAADRAPGRRMRLAPRGLRRGVPEVLLLRRLRFRP